MKKYLLILLLFLVTTSQAQQFSFQMYFTDAVGNKDTLTLGYDTAATKLIDTAFGEVNIIGIPLDTAFDVRVTDEFERRHAGFQATFHTKRQIIFYDCDSATYNNQVIDIYTKHWPVTATWNKTLFTDTCRNWSCFAGSLGDVHGPTDLYWVKYMENDSVTFTSNAFPFPPGGGWFQYDSIPVFFQMFNDGSIQVGAIHEQGELNDPIKIFPNPASNLISIDVKDEVATNFYNIYGQLVLSSQKKKNIDISILPEGLYLIRATNKSGQTGTMRFQKI